RSVSGSRTRRISAAPRALPNANAPRRNARARSSNTLLRDRDRWSGGRHRRHAHLEQLIQDCERLLVPLISALRLNRIVEIIQAHGHASVRGRLMALEDLECIARILTDRRRWRIGWDVEPRFPLVPP